MSTFPSALLRSHVTSNEPSDAEDVLFELLHSLADLPSPSSIDNLVDWASAVLFQEAAGNTGTDTETDHNATANGEMNIEHEWKCGLDLLRKLVNPGTADPLASIAIPPHVLLRCTVERSMGYHHHQQQQQQLDQRKRLSMFKVMCVLLVSIALRYCALSVVNMNTPRWGRIQSMCMEAIALYQTLLVPVPPIMEQPNEYAKFNLEVMNDLRAMSKLYCDYLSPSLCNLLSAMEQSQASQSQHCAKGGPSKHKSKAIAAGMVKIASTLSFSITETTLGQSNDTEAVGKCLALDLTRAMLNIPSFGQDYIWIHPLRQEYECSRCYHGTTFDIDYNEEESLVESHAEARIMREVSPLLCNEMDEIGLAFDALCGMGIKWNQDAIAVMAYAVISIGRDETVDAPIILPTVYSANMMFTLFFPHMATLFSLSQKELEVEQDDDGSIPNDEQSALAADLRKQQRYFGMGMEILESLLDRMEPESFVQDAIRDGEYGRDSLGKGLLSPVGTIQLLLNQLVNISSSSRRLPPSDSDEIAPQRVILIIRGLLSIYSTKVQLSSIRLLLKCCPFPFLLPILLDLTRNTVSSDNFCDANAVFELLAPYLDEMKSCLSQHHGPNAVDDIGKLVENIEAYASVVSLFRLLFLGQHRDCKEVVDKVMNDMEELSSALRSVLEMGDNAGDKSDGEVPSFRLFLLEGALTDLFAARDRVQESMVWQE